MHYILENILLVKDLIIKREELRKIKLIINLGINIKKIPSLPQEITQEKINFIKLYRNKYNLNDLFDVLNISKSNYYKYRNTKNYEEI